jgi:N-acetylneuraminic acid mutarotase
MKNKLQILGTFNIWIFCCLIGMDVSGQADSWTRKSDIGGSARMNAVAFSIGNKGYLGTGLSYLVVNNVNTEVYNDDFWEFDPATNIWTQKANFPGGPRWRATAFSIGSRGYVGTGITDNNYSNSNNDFWEFDPYYNVWTRKADFAGGLRQSAVGFRIADKGYIGTGGDQFNLLADFWQYDPATDSWTKKADYAGNQTRGSAVGFNIGDKGYIGTGSGDSATHDFWEYDPVTDSWIEKAHLPAAERQGAVGFSVGDRGFVGTGLDNNSAVHSDFWEYNPFTNSWKQRTDFPGPARCFGIGFSAGYKGYIGTGVSQQGPLTKDFWEYTPEILPDTVASVIVPGTANPWLAGMPDGTQAALGDNVPANSPVLANVKLTTGSWIEVSEITGTVAHGPDPPFLGPEGCLSLDPCFFTNISHDVGAEYGKSNLTAPINSLVGVFLDNNIPGDPPPPALDFSTQETRDYVELHPQLKQVFFIGDAKTSTGVQQKVFVPTGATRLFLGIMDGIEWTGNSGAFYATVRVMNNTPADDCSNGGNKVRVCHKGKTLCVASNAVRAHMAHGDQIGSCSVGSALRISNTPNPFRRSTRIQYEIPAEGHVQIKVYDAIGTQIASPVDAELKRGVYSFYFDSPHSRSAVYYYRITYSSGTNNIQIKTGKMIVIN